MERYRDFNQYLRSVFGQRVQKIPIDAGFSCPNRDGTISTRGCLFCDPRGSGTGAWIESGLDIDEQIKRSIQFLKRRYKAKKFIAYFQSFTNTYASVDTLRSKYDRALSHKDIVGLAIGTRPDCVDDQILELISSYKDQYMVWIEYGLQSAHDTTLEAINRGHDVACLEKSVFLAHQFGINICVHVILGLPGETREMMLETAKYVSTLPVQGIKIHLLYVLEDTPLAADYKKARFQCMTREEYIELVVDYLELLPPRMIIQRLTGDPPARARLVAPSWAKDKTENINLIRQRLIQRDTWQGRLYKGSG